MMRIALLVLAVLARTSGSYSAIINLDGWYDAIAGCTPATNVTAHAAIDLDVTIIINALDGTDAGYAAAIDSYTNSGESANRVEFCTLQRVSRALSGETEREAGAAHWGSDTYADEIVMDSDALNGSEYAYMYTTPWGSCCE